MGIRDRKIKRVISVTTTLFKGEKYDQPRNFEDRDGTVCGGFFIYNVYERDIMEIIKDYEESL